MPRKKYSYTLKDIYNLIEDPVVEYSEFKIVIHQLLKDVFKRILRGEVVILPHLLDEIYLCKCTPKNTLYNGKGEPIDNSHTDGYSLKTCRKRGRYKGSRLFSFKLSKSNRDKIKALLDEDFNAIYNYPDI